MALTVRVLEDLKRLEENATPAVWSRAGSRTRMKDEDCVTVGPDRFSIIFVPIGRTLSEHAGAIRDAELVARLRNNAKELIRESARLPLVIEDLESRLKAVLAMTDSMTEMEKFQLRFLEEIIGVLKGKKKSEGDKR